MKPIRISAIPAALALFLMGADRPPLQDGIEWSEPAAGTYLKVNPPTFRWPEREGRGSYRIELSQSKDLSSPTRVQTDDIFYRPLQPLRPGRWYWHVRRGEGGWTSIESFEISPSLPTWAIRDWSELVRNIPTAHPRLYIRPEELKDYRAKANGPLRAEVAAWAQKRRKLIGAAERPPKFDANTDPGSPGGDESEQKLRANKIRTWAAKAGSHQLMEGVADLVWISVLTNDSQFAAEAQRRVLQATRMDPETELTDRDSDFANANIVGQGAVAYDLLYDRFTPDERAKIRAMLAARIAPIMHKIERSPRRPFQAHGWQHTYLDALMGALAIYGEEPRAAKWVETGLKTFVAFYPWFGGLDGGSAEATNYYTCCEMLTSLRTADVFKTAFQIDFAQNNPWFRANPWYLMYALPPGAMRSLFGDVNPNRYYESAGPDHRLAARRMAALYDNGYAADYASRLEDEAGGDAALERFLWSPMKLPARQSIATLPGARAFRDIGMVFMHSEMADASRNIRFEFRSSPYGSTGHGHSDQNSFNIIAFNEPLILDSGYYTAAGDRHHAGWTRQTKAHNSVLVDGSGQAREEGAATQYAGRITHFDQTAEWAYAVGDASAAYDKVPLERFDRHTVWFRGKDVQTYVIVDDIAAKSGEHQFQWLLHAARQMKLDPASQRIAIANTKAEARVVLIEPAKLAFRQSDQFDPPPENWRPDRQTDYKNQWHLTAETTEPAPAARYYAVIQVGRSGFHEAPVERLRGGVRVAGWDVRLNGNRLAIAKTK